MIQQSLRFETDKYYYFFMKCGHGNSLLPYARMMGGLWVGYFEQGLPAINVDGLCETDAATSDLQFITVVTQSRLRAKIRIVTFGKDSLLIWKPTGPLQFLDSTKSNVDWSNKSVYSAFPKSWLQEMESKFGGVGSNRFIREFFSGHAGAKIIPAELVHSIPRASLLGCVDSLSVWQSLNRRTFQPIFSLRGNKSLADLSWLHNQESLEPIPVSKNRVLEEQSFGKFIRLYLEERLFGTKSVSESVPQHELIKTVLAVLNPAQIETAVMHLCRDLGLTIDVALGKSLDVTDVKATVRHLPRRERMVRVRRALRLLEQVGVRFSDILRCEFQATSTLRIQCKAYSDVDRRNLGNTLLAIPTSSTDKHIDCLELEKLANHDGKLLPEFFGWLRLLQSDVTPHCQYA